MKKKCIIGGIVSHRAGGYGFKLTFVDTETAAKYKDRISNLLMNDNIILDKQKGYFG